MLGIWICPFFSINSHFCFRYIEYCALRWVFIKILFGLNFMVFGLFFFYSKFFVTCLFVRVTYKRQFNTMLYSLNVKIFLKFFFLLLWIKHTKHVSVMWMVYKDFFHLLTPNRVDRRAGLICNVSKIVTVFIKLSFEYENSWFSTAWQLSLNGTTKAEKIRKKIWENIKLFEKFE